MLLTLWISPVSSLHQAVRVTGVQCVFIANPPTSVHVSACIIVYSVIPMRLVGM